MTGGKGGKSELSEDMERLYLESGPTTKAEHAGRGEITGLMTDYPEEDNEYYLLRDRESEEEQFGNLHEAQGRGIGEFDGSIGNVKHGAPDDFSERGLYADENYSRDSYGFGDGAVASRTYDSARPERSFNFYDDAGESEFSIRSAEGEIDSPREGSEVPSSATNYGGISPRALSGNDEELMERVSDALAAHSEIDAGRLSVEVENAIVRLEGEISSLDHKWHLEEFVSRVHGVSDVENNLRVKRQG